MEESVLVVGLKVEIFCNLPHHRYLARKRAEKACFGREVQSPNPVIFVGQRLLVLVVKERKPRPEQRAETLWPRRVEARGRQMNDALVLKPA